MGHVSAQGRRLLVVQRTRVVSRQTQTDRHICIIPDKHVCGSMYLLGLPCGSVRSVYVTLGVNQAYRSWGVKGVRQVEYGSLFMSLVCAARRRQLSGFCHSVTLGPSSLRHTPGQSTVLFYLIRLQQAGMPCPCPGLPCLPRLNVIALLRVFICDLACNLNIALLPVWLQ